jgi:hypothetical protein
MEWKPEAFVAVYAACVSTGALLIQFRNWLASGPRLRCNLIPDGKVTGGDERFDESNIVLVSATNVGSADTMIMGLTLEQRWPFYYFWRRRPIAVFVIANPQLKGFPPNVPSLLEPAHTWSGIIRKRADLIKNIRDGDHYACVHVSTRKRPYRMRIAPDSSRLG